MHKQQHKTPSNSAQHVSYLLLGGNLGEPQQYLKAARRQISQQIGQIDASSSLYQSEPWGFSHDNNFINQVLRVRTELSPQQLLAQIHCIENNLGRLRNNQGYEARTIDIDILYYDNVIIRTDKLQIPHIRLHQRMFTLLPLCDIAPNLTHPVFGIDTNDLLKLCADASTVNRLMHCLAIDEFAATLA